MRRPPLARAGCLLAAADLGVLPSAQAGPVRAVAGETTGLRAEPREVMFVGNNWAGTADARTFEVLRRIDIVPDHGQRLREIATDPIRLAYYLAIQQAVEEGHDQLVDDMFATRDGRLLAVSRPSFADVVWIDLAAGAACDAR